MNDGALDRGSRVLVTGASGLIGRHVLELLRGRVRLFAVSREARPTGDGVTWVRGDLATPGGAAQLLSVVEPTAVIHLAGAVRGDRSLEAVSPTLQGNLVGTVELLEAVTRAGVPRIVVSGSALEEPVSLDPKWVPPSPYAVSRTASSMFARMFHAHFGTPVTVLRPSYVYGPWQLDKLVPHVIRNAMRGVSPELTSGDRLLDFVYARDVAGAYIAALTSPSAIGATVDIGSGRLARVRDVVEKLLELVGPEAPRALYGAVEQRRFEQDVEIDTEPAERTLGWSATTSLEDGLRNTVEWFRARAADQLDA
jgi:nucleoside-diphosphate-sugar epimerase